MIMIEGPNKVGKSTLRKDLLEILGFHGYFEKCNWPGATVKHQEYFADRMTSGIETSKSAVAVWDRAWPSNFIYRQLLPDRPEAYPLESAVMAEIDFGLPMQTIGNGIILNRSEPFERDTEDPEVPFEKEVELYLEYGKRFPHWKIIDISNYSRSDIYGLAKLLAYTALKRLSESDKQLWPPRITGNLQSELLIVGPGLYNEDKSKRPLDNKAGNELLVTLGPLATIPAYTYVQAVNPAKLNSFPLVIALGNKAYTWARYYIRAEQVIQLPIPRLLAEADVTFIQKTIATIAKRRNSNA